MAHRLDAGTPAAREPSRLPEETAELTRRVREVMAGAGIEVDAFVRRAGSLKVVPSQIPLADEALALQLARIANSLPAAGLGRANAARRRRHAGRRRRAALPSRSAERSPDTFITKMIAVRAAPGGAARKMFA